MTPVVPGFLPFALLSVLEAAAALVWRIFVRGWPAAFDRVLLCPRCTRLQERAEALARAADAVAVGALTFLVALPFVAAAYEDGLTFPRLAMGISAIAAVLAVAAEVDFLARAAAARLLPQFSWDAEPARLIGGGARWFGVALVLYLFQRPDLPGRGIAGLFDGVGEHLAADLPSTAAIYAGATMLLFSAIIALGARWVVPFLLNSLPVTLAPRRERHGRST